MNGGASYGSALAEEKGVVTGMKVSRKSVMAKSQLMQPRPKQQWFHDASYQEVIFHSSRRAC
ncbi:hypothetical protein BN135_347 [Cronobacter muytjensii 530]